MAKKSTAREERPLKFQCSNCRAEITTTYAKAGSRATCNVCGAFSEVPLPTVSLGIRKARTRGAKISKPVSESVPESVPDNSVTKGEATYSKLNPETGSPKDKTDAEGKAGNTTNSPDPEKGMDRRRTQSPNELPAGTSTASAVETKGSARAWLVLVAAALLGVILGAGGYLATGGFSERVTVLDEDDLSGLTSDEVTDETPQPPDPDTDDPVTVLVPEPDPSPTPSPPPQPAPTPTPSPQPTPQPAPLPTIPSLDASAVEVQWSLLLRRYEAADSTFEEIVRLTTDARNPIFASDTDFVDSILRRVDQLKEHLASDRQASVDAVASLQQLHGVDSAVFDETTQAIRQEYFDQGRQSLVQYLDLLAPFTRHNDLSKFNESWENRFAVE